MNIWPYFKQYSLMMLKWTGWGQICEREPASCIG